MGGYDCKVAESVKKLLTLTLSPSDGERGLAVASLRTQVIASFPISSSAFWQYHFTASDIGG